MYRISKLFQYPLQKKAGRWLLASAISMLGVIVSRQPGWILTESGWVRVTHHPAYAVVFTIACVVSLIVAFRYLLMHKAIADEMRSRGH